MALEGYKVSHHVLKGLPCVPQGSIGLPWVFCGLGVRRLFLQSFEWNRYLGLGVRAAVF